MPRGGWLAVGACCAGSRSVPSCPRACSCLRRSLGGGHVLGAALAVARRVGGAGCGHSAASRSRRDCWRVRSWRPPCRASAERATRWPVERAGPHARLDRRRPAAGVLLVRAADPTAAQTGHRVRGGCTRGCPRYPALIPTDRITFDGPLEPVRQDGSEFAAYLERHRRRRDRPHPRADRPGRGDGGPVRYRGARSGRLPMRRWPGCCRSRWPGSPPASSWVVATGSRARSRTASRRPGLSHVVAISGWNIASSARSSAGLLRAAGHVPPLAHGGHRRRAARGFTLLAGGGASVVRAALMGGVALVARETGRPGQRRRRRSACAVWMLLLLDPAMVTDIGFQLSVAATAGLLAWGSAADAPAAGRRARAGRAAGWPSRWACRWRRRPRRCRWCCSISGGCRWCPRSRTCWSRPSWRRRCWSGRCGPGGRARRRCSACRPSSARRSRCSAGWCWARWSPSRASSRRCPWRAWSCRPPVGRDWRPLAHWHRWSVVVAWRGRGASGPSRRTVASGRAGRREQAPGSARQPPSRRRSRARGRARGGRGAGGRWVLAAMAGSGTGRLSVTVLDVGQGDAILVEGPRGGRMLLDSGPDPDRLLTVLDRHVPAVGPAPRPGRPDPSARGPRRGTGHAAGARTGSRPSPRTGCWAPGPATRRSARWLAAIRVVDTPARGRRPPGARRHRRSTSVAVAGEVPARSPKVGRARQRHLDRARRPVRRATAAAHRRHRGRRRPDACWRRASADR